MFMNISYADWQVIGVICSSIVSTAAFIWTLYESRKNSKESKRMIEETTRPIIGIYTDYVNTGDLMFYLVIRNFGKSIAIINSIDDGNAIRESDGFRIKKDETTNYFADLVNSTLAPNQSKIFPLNYKTLRDKVVTFKISYSSSQKTYEEQTTFNISAGVLSPKPKYATENKEIKSISYTLQEILQRGL